MVDRLTKVPVYLTAFLIRLCVCPTVEDDWTTPDPELRSPFRTESAATASWWTTAAILRITNNVDGRLLYDCCSYFLYNLPVVIVAVAVECMHNSSEMYISKIHFLNNFIQTNTVKMKISLSELGHICILNRLTVDNAKIGINSLTTPYIQDIIKIHLYIYTFCFSCTSLFFYMHPTAMFFSIVYCF